MIVKAQLTNPQDEKLTNHSITFADFFALPTDLQSGNDHHIQENWVNFAITDISHYCQSTVLRWMATA